MIVSKNLLLGCEKNLRSTESREVLQWMLREPTFPPAQYRHFHCLLPLYRDDLAHRNHDGYEGIMGMM
jgi:hypothetical protein